MPDAMDTLRAVVDLAFPEGDGIPSGLSVKAEEHIRDGIELILPGATELLTALLDGGAMERGADSFLALPADGREHVFRAMLADPVADIRETAEAVLLFGFGAIYSEWSSYDPSSRTLTRPPVWDTVGYDGPVLGHPDYGDA
jgi:hypothetical protein